MVISYGRQTLCVVLSFTPEGHHTVESVLIAPLSTMESRRQRREHSQQSWSLLEFTLKVKAKRTFTQEVFP